MYCHQFFIKSILLLPWLLVTSSQLVQRRNSRPPARSHCSPETTLGSTTDYVSLDSPFCTSLDLPSSSVEALNSARCLYVTDIALLQCLLRQSSFPNLQQVYILSDLSDLEDSSISITQMSLLISKRIESWKFYAYELFPNVEFVDVISPRLHSGILLYAYLLDLVNLQSNDAQITQQIDQQSLSLLNNLLASKRFPLHFQDDFGNTLGHYCLLPAIYAFGGFVYSKQSLHYVKQCIESALAYGFLADSIPNRSGMTTLHIASALESSDILDFLLKFGLNVNARDPNFDITPLHISLMSASKFQDKVQARLMNIADQIMGGYAYDSLWPLDNKPDPFVLVNTKAVNVIDKFNRLPYSLLLNYNPDLSLTTINEGRTVFHIVAMASTQIAGKTFIFHRMIDQLQLDQWSLLDIQDHEGWTVLMYLVVARNDLLAHRVLSQPYLDLNLKNNNNETVTHLLLKTYLSRKNTDLTPDFALFETIMDYHAQPIPTLLNTKKALPQIQKITTTTSASTVNENHTSLFKKWNLCIEDHTGKTIRNYVKEVYRQFPSFQSCYEIFELNYSDSTTGCIIS